MKKRLLAVILALALALSGIPAAWAADDAHTEAAQCLYELGLFQGVGTNADGTPDFALDRAPTRAEAVTMLVRLLGKEEEAKAGTWETPFTDVADWAKPYVGYAYANNLTTGTGATTFGGDITVNATQYLTMVLRALGYSDKWEDDFQWDAAWGKADKVGLTHGEYDENTTSFTRGDVAVISKSALTTPRLWKPESEQFFYVLFEEGVIIPEQVKASKLEIPPALNFIESGYIRIGEKRYKTFGPSFDGYLNFPINHEQDYYTGTVYVSVYTLAIWDMLLEGKYEIVEADSAFLDGRILFPVADAPYKEEETVRREVSLGKYEYDHKVTAFGKEICWTTSGVDSEEYRAKQAEAMGLVMIDCPFGAHYDVDDLLDYFEITDPAIREKLASPKIEEIDGNKFLVID